MDRTQIPDLDKETKLLRTLSTADEEYGDILMLSHDGARAVLAPTRLVLVDYLEDHEVESIRGLARELDRDKGEVSRDLSVLAQHGVVEYEGDGKGTPKRPRLTHDTILVTPIA